MKKVSKCDVVLVICLFLGGALLLASWLFEVIVGKDILILEIPGSLLMFCSSMVMTSIYASNAIVRVIQSLQEKRKQKDKRM